MDHDSAIARTAAWETDQYDPNNYFIAPRLGGPPHVDSLEGHAVPLVTPEGEHRSLRRILRHTLGTLRTTVASHGFSFAELEDLAPARDALEADGFERLSLRQSMAYLFRECMGDLGMALAHVQLDAPQQAQEHLAAALSWLELLVQIASGQLTALLPRLAAKLHQRALEQHRTHGSKGGLGKSAIREEFRTWVFNEAPKEPGAVKEVARKLAKRCPPHLAAVVRAEGDNERVKNTKKNEEEPVDQPYLAIQRLVRDNFPAIKVERERILAATGSSAS